MTSATWRWHARRYRHSKRECGSQSDPAAVRTPYSWRGSRHIGSPAALNPVRSSGIDLNRYFRSEVARLVVPVFNNLHLYLERFALQRAGYIPFYV